jgi:hypothetical protein
MDERDYIAMQKYLNENDIKAIRERRANKLMKRDLILKGMFTKGIKRYIDAEEYNPKPKNNEEGD